MKVLHSWLQKHISEELPLPKEIEEKLVMHAYEVEGVEHIPGDVVYDIKIIPDRSHDSLSHRGIAREIAALFKLTRKESGYVLPDTVRAPQITAEIKDTTRCPNFGIIEIDNVVIGPSPKWLVTALEALGQRSINNVVDATNFVMLDMGKPMHAFDRAKITGSKLVVRRATEGEALTTLDNKEVQLTTSDLVIADASFALSLAGIKGGKRAEVDSQTTSVVLESANFTGSMIRKTSVRTGIKTDASKRFESGLTSEWTRESLIACAALIKEIAGSSNTVVSEITEIYPKPERNYTVGVSLKEVNHLLGLTLSSGDVADVFTRKSFAFESVSPLQRAKELVLAAVEKPYKRGASVLFDSPLTFDCSSLTAYVYAQVGYAIPRIAVDQFVYGYDRNGEIQVGDLVFANTGIVRTTTGSHYSQVLEKEVEEQAVRYSSVEWMPGTEVPLGVDHVGIYVGDGKIVHATSSQGKVVIEDMKTSTQFANVVGIKYIATDTEDRFVVRVPFERQDIRIKEDLIDEIGRMVGYGNTKETTHYEGLPVGNSHKRLYYGNQLRNLLVEQGFNEVMTYSFAEDGEVAIANSVDPKRNKMRTSLTPGVRQALEKGMYYGPFLALEKIQIFELGNVCTDTETMHLAIGVYTKNKKEKKLLAEHMTTLSQSLAIIMPIITSLVPVVTEQDGLVVYEYNFDELVSSLPEPVGYTALKHVEHKEGHYQSLSVFPFISRDVAVFVPSGIDEKSLLQELTSLAGILCVKSYQFDRFQKEGENQVSLGYRFVFQAFDRTLADSDIESQMEQIYNALTKKGYAIR